ncbi:uncharacterized protein LOC136078731 [Hydra vulgaris]|uniref:Uncharacterized protein LOC136078731 n=1 Tax=Hydra vulgaris TaxID=6087 RepID=A0ABM4BND2_HYDVU
MNSTNNHLENFKGKLKEVIDCNSSLEDFLDKSYVVLTSMRNERNHKIIFQMQKVSVDVFDPNSAEAAYKKVLTLYAARHVLKQMSLLKEVTLLLGEHGHIIANSHEDFHVATKVKVYSQHEKFKLAVQETSLLATPVSESRGRTLEQCLSLLRALSKGTSLIPAKLVVSDAVNLTTFSAVGTGNSIDSPISIDVSTLPASICSTYTSTMSASKNVAYTDSINSANVNSEVALVAPKVLNKESISVVQIGTRYEILNNNFLSEQAEVAEKAPYQQEELTSGRSDADILAWHGFTCLNMLYTVGVLNILL